MVQGEQGPDGDPASTGLNAHSLETAADRPRQAGAQATGLVCFSGFGAELGTEPPFLSPTCGHFLPPGTLLPSSVSPPRVSSSRTSPAPSLPLGLRVEVETGVLSKANRTRRLKGGIFLSYAEARVK